jgi:hypothetical protein
MKKTTLAACLAATVFLSGIASASATTLGYWRFEECAPDALVTGTGSVVDDVGLNNGSPGSDPFYRTDVPVGTVPQTGAANTRSLELDGDFDQITIFHAPTIDPVSAFTVEFWMKASPDNAGKHFLVVDKSHGFTDSTGWLFQGDPTAGQLFFGVGNGSGGAGGFPGVLSSISLLDDEWHHIAGSYDSTDTGQEMKLYIDGVLDGTASGIYVSNTRDIHIGAAWGGGRLTRFFDGLVDEVRISDTALSTDQFLNAAAPLPVPGMAALFGLTLTGIGMLRRRHAAR